MKIYERGLGWDREQNWCLYGEYVEADRILEQSLEPNGPFGHAANLRMRLLQFLADVAQAVRKTHSCRVFAFILGQCEIFAL